jgi:outer membrane murein-binding lipoprotein Lpp
MRHDGRLAALLLVGMVVVLYSSRSEAQSFYTGGGNNMFRVFGCPSYATLNLNGTGPTQQGDCTIFQTGAVVPAVPIETWVAAQVSGAVSGLQAQNEKLQKQVDELTARVQALEAAARQPRSAAPGPKPSP